MVRRGREENGKRKNEGELWETAEGEGEGKMRWEKTAREKESKRKGIKEERVNERSTKKQGERI